MIGRMLLVTILVCAALNTGAAADDLNGKAYIFFVPVSESGFDVDAELVLPGYAVFGDDGGRVYGSLVMPDIELFAGLAAPPGSSVDSLIDMFALFDGSWAKGRFSVQLTDPATGEKKEKITVAVLKGGLMLQTAVTGAGGKKVPITFFLLDVNDDFSGLYFGKLAYGGLPAPRVSNVAFGAVILDNEMMFAYAAYFARQPAVWGCSEVDHGAEFDPQTGGFHYDLDPNQAAFTGAIGGDKTMTIDMDLAGGGSASGALKYFADQRKGAKIKKVAPETLPAGKDTVVTITHKGAIPGALVSEDNEDVYIKGFVHKGKNTIEVTVSVDSKAGGQVKFSITNPDGKTTTAKAVAIQ